MSDAQSALNSIAAQIDAIAAARRARATGSRAAAQEEDAAASLLDGMAADVRAARIRDPKVLRNLRSLQYTPFRQIRGKDVETARTAAAPVARGGRAMSKLTELVAARRCRREKDRRHR